MLSTKKLMYKVLNTLLGVLGIGTVTFTATTLNQGTIDISGYLPTNAYPLTVECTGRTAFGLFAGRNWIRIETWDGSPIGNTQVTLKIYYVRKVGGGYCVASVFSRLSAIASHLKGWWHHADSKEIALQIAHNAERLLNSSRIHRHIADDRGIQCHNEKRPLIIERDTKWLQGDNGNLAICRWLHLLLLRSNHNGYRQTHISDKKCGCFTENRNSIISDTLRKGITSSISERGWAVC